MSKGNSRLFEPRTETVDIFTVRNMAYLAVHELINSDPKNKRKAMVIGAYDSKTGEVCAKFAGPIPDTIHPELQKRADEIGGLGSLGVSGKNQVGVCAEFQAVNQLLLSGSNIADIRLTPAMRPKNGAVIDYCPNCKAMFKDILNKK